MSSAPSADPLSHTRCSSSVSVLLIKARCGTSHNRSSSTRYLDEQHNEIRAWKLVEKEAHRAFQAARIFLASPIGLHGN